MLRSSYTAVPVLAGTFVIRTAQYATNHQLYFRCDLKRCNKYSQRSIIFRSFVRSRRTCCAISLDIWTITMRRRKKNSWFMKGRFSKLRTQGISPLDVLKVVRNWTEVEKKFYTGSWRSTLGPERKVKKMSVVCIWNNSMEELKTMWPRKRSRCVDKKFWRIELKSYKKSARRPGWSGKSACDRKAPVLSTREWIAQYRVVNCTNDISLLQRHAARRRVS